mmetsp:Transcript_855/g.2346  ORF Transcript_855/g.2346 Transcript_855/m.2346 type:complete len:208 (-) Transcript_855:12-635(-)
MPVAGHARTSARRRLQCPQGLPGLLCFARAHPGRHIRPAHTCRRPARNKCTRASSRPCRTSPGRDKMAPRRRFWRRPPSCPGWPSCWRSYRHSRRSVFSCCCLCPCHPCHPCRRACRNPSWLRRRSHLLTATLRLLTAIHSLLRRLTATRRSLPTTILRLPTASLRFLPTASFHLLPVATPCPGRGHPRSRTSFTPAACRGRALSRG